ncbi:MAG: DUF1223 domain-containing protein, partial [Hyphomonadaceae bacterium]
ADLWIVTFDPGPDWVTIQAGDNRGQRLAHYNLVRTIRHAGEWRGEPVSFTRASCARHSAVLVQGENGGPILAAARTPPPPPRN